MTKNDWIEALKKMVFVMLSYIFLGLAAGIALQEAGLSPLQTTAMSALAFTGSGQFLSATMLAEGAPITSIILLIFFLNLRFSLMTSSMTPYLKGKSTAFTMLFTHTTTDEPFGINTYQFNQNEDWTVNKALAANVLAWLTWIVSTTAGTLIGDAISIPTTIINYVMIAMFISMMIDQMKNRSLVVSGLASGVIAVFFQAFFNTKLSIVIGAVAGSAVGYYVGTYRDKKVSLGGESHDEK